MEYQLLIEQIQNLLKNYIALAMQKQHPNEIKLANLLDKLKSLLDEMKNTPQYLRQEASELMLLLIAKEFGI